MANGHLFIISAASGAGKTSLIKALLTKNPDIKLSISHTTRAPRPSEQNGVDYYFVNDAEFTAMMARAEFLESAHVHNARYGTSQIMVEETLKAGQDVLLEIDWQGAQQVRQQHPEAISIFILPPSLAELEQRLNDRGQDTQEVIKKRVAAARDEMRHVVEFDYVTINDNFEIALGDLLAIIRAQRLTLTHQLDRYQSLIQALT